MTDDRRLEIERRFDGELDGLDPGESPSDPESRRHLDRLVLLRDLARRHDPAASLSPTVFVPPRPGQRLRPRRAMAWLALSATAAAVALACWPLLRGVDRPRLAPLEPTRGGGVVARSPGATTGRPPLEVALYGWANAPSRASEQAARLVLSPAPTSRKRSPADEILALELANTSPQPRGGVQRFAVARGARLAPSSKPLAPSNRAKPTHPDV